MVTFGGGGGLTVGGTVTVVFEYLIDVEGLGYGFFVGAVPLGDGCGGGGGG